MMKIFTILGLFILSTLPAKADLSWMKGVEDCQSYASALDAYLNKVDLSKYSLFPFWQKEELSIALREACEGNYSKCNLEACKKWGSLTKFSAPAESGAYSSLAWLNRFLTCEQLMEQIKSRYTNLTDTEISNSTKQKEFRLVLTAACSERFSHCSFSSCEQFNQGKIDKSQLTSLTNESKEKKQALNYQALRDSIIRLAVEKETKEGLEWKRFSNTEEAEVISRRKEEARSRKRNDEYESGSSSSSYPATQYNSISSSSRSVRRPKKSYSSEKNTSLQKGILPF